MWKPRVILGQGCVGRGSQSSGQGALPAAEAHDGGKGPIRRRWIHGGRWVARGERRGFSEAHGFVGFPNRGCVSVRGGSPRSAIVVAVVVAFGVVAIIGLVLLWRRGMGDAQRGWGRVRVLPDLYTPREGVVRVKPSRALIAARRGPLDRPKLPGAEPHLLDGVAPPMSRERRGGMAPRPGEPGQASIAQASGALLSWRRALSGVDRKSVV